MTTIAKVGVSLNASRYTETIDLLYSGNMFACLQNQALLDLHRSTLPHRFAKIRALHIHWQFKETSWTRRGFAAPWDDHTFLFAKMAIVPKLPELETLSIFFQGPLLLQFGYERLLRGLHPTSSWAASPKLFVVRFPWPAYNAGIRFDRLGPINELLENPDLPFQVCQPALQPGQDPYEMADLDMVDDTGWRVGAMFSSPLNGGSGFVTTSYAVFTSF